MTTTRFPFAIALPILLSLSACGDDLESRNAATGMQEGEAQAQGTMRIERQRTQPKQQPATAFSDEPGESRESSETVIDATPDDLVQDTQGFDTAPMDDTSGIDPMPAQS
ncbi:MAG: hypothetical protein P1U62_09040 [Alteraurantiacibacter sp. bin_em_oilr2.035]|nr:hypothetical protein [Alteraurantiacibacter sp. bin_em_oilr2.035]